MGILTDASLNQRNHLGRNFLKHNRKICALFYLAGAVWFCCLGHSQFNHATYLSENALSPGLVYSEIKVESARIAQNYLDELNREREVYRSGIPYNWIMAKMQQIGLEVYTHNFTLHYPLGSGREFHGKNIYGILRAPRIGSTEGIVFSAPYRPPESVHPDITASVPLLLAFAEFTRRKNYWAKDLIFLVTDREQLGMHAWLEAYYKGDLEDASALDAGNLKGRAGALQAALNLEIQDFDAEYLNVKIEGLNGQLPNLDMFNLIQRIAARELPVREPCGYKQTSPRKRAKNKNAVLENVKAMLSMLLSQANGVPTGNHGLFHRYRVEALTLEAVKKPKSDYQSRGAAVLPLLKVIEGVSRSLNNLLERFHQSYFFYILVSNDRFVSIGDFIPCLLLMAGPLFIKAFFLWLGLNVEDPDMEKCDEDEKQAESSQTELKPIVKKELDLQYSKVLRIFLIAHLIGFLASVMPENRGLNEVFATLGLSSNQFITGLAVVFSIVALLAPHIVELNYDGVELLHIVTLLELASVLVVVGLLNFALGFLLSIVIAPAAILVDRNHNASIKCLNRFYVILLHPLIVSYGVVLILTLSAFPELGLLAVAQRAIGATMDALTYSVVDSIIYGNWVYNAVTIAFLSNWMMLWRVVCYTKTEEGRPKLKTS